MIDDKEFYLFIADKIKKLRMSLGYTQKQCTDILGIELNLLKKIENAETDFDILLFLQITKIFDTNPQDFFVELYKKD